MAVALVLDKTAVAAYPGLAVGELLAEIGDEGHHFAVSVVSLAAAAADTSVNDVTLLVKHRRCRRMPVAVDAVTHLGNWIRVLGDVERAAAMAEARRHRAYLLTAVPGAYGDDLDGVVIGI